MGDARPLTIAHQGLAACLVQLCATPFLDDGAEDAAAMLAEFLPHAHGDGVTAEALVGAARVVVACWPKRKIPGQGVDWTRALSDARMAVCTYYRGRAAACHARVFPATQPEAAADAQS
jgi:hypothetical protein